jgi:hypothetical protein
MVLLAVVRIPTTAKSFFLFSFHDWLFQVGYRERGGYGVVSCGANSNNSKNVFSYFLSMIGYSRWGTVRGVGMVLWTQHFILMTALSRLPARKGEISYYILFYYIDSVFLSVDLSH